MFAVITLAPAVIPSCYGSFFEHMINNFFETNAAIWGMTVPLGVTLISRGATAEAVGGFTFKVFLKSNFWKKPFFLGNLIRVAIGVAIINWILAIIAYEIGVMIGSAISASFCKNRE